MKPEQTLATRLTRLILEKIEIKRHFQLRFVSIRLFELFFRKIGFYFLLIP